MLIQKCRLEVGPDQYVWVQTIDKTGTIVTAKEEAKALILANMYWSEVIKKHNLQQFKPHLFDVL